MKQLDGMHLDFFWNAGWDLDLKFNSTALLLLIMHNAIVVIRSLRVLFITWNSDGGPPFLLDIITCIMKQKANESKRS